MKRNVSAEFAGSSYYIGNEQVKDWKMWKTQFKDSHELCDLAEAGYLPSDTLDDESNDIINELKLIQDYYV